MATPAPRSRRIWRRVAIAVATVVLALVVAMVVYVHRLLQPERFTTLLESNLAAAGLQLALQDPAEPALFPRPAVRLQGFSLTNRGSRIPVLQADGATIVVPWSALLRGEVAMERVDISAPRIDLGELETLLARLPAQATSPRLPSIATGVHMRKGMVTRNGMPMLLDFSLATGALEPGRTFQLEASARTVAGRRFSVAFATIPTATDDGSIDFDDLNLALAEHGGAALQLTGKGHWRGGSALAAHLQGTLQHRPLAASSAAPSPDTPAGATPAPRVTSRVAFEVLPARGDVPLTVALKLDGHDMHVDFSVHPARIGDWWQHILAAQPGEPAATPPFSGTVRAGQLDFGWFKATDLSIDAGGAMPPAANASSAPAPAASLAH